MLKSKKIAFFTIAAMAVCCFGVYQFQKFKYEMARTPATDYTGSVYSDVWAIVKASEYPSLPMNTISYVDLILGGKDSASFAASAWRTLNDRSDVLPYFDKLIRYNGLCLTGDWEITENSPYTGYFASQAHGKIIARATVGFNETTVGNERSFGLAGKIFPVSDASDATANPTANFFTIDDNGGSKVAHFTDVTLRTEPLATKTAFLITHLPMFEFLKETQHHADPLGHEGLRQLYPISELGLPAGTQELTPYTMELEPPPTQAHYDAADFRDELRVKNYGGQLLFDIYVRAAEGSERVRLGRITFRDDAASEACDHRLHFSHPLFRN